MMKLCRHVRGMFQLFFKLKHLKAHFSVKLSYLCKPCFYRIFSNKILGILVNFNFNFLGEDLVIITSPNIFLYSLFDY